MIKNDKVSAKKCVILICIALAVSCSPKVRSDSRFIRSGYEIYPPKPKEYEVIVLQDAEEVKWYVEDIHADGYDVIGLVFADAEASANPVKIGCVNFVSGSEADAADERITEALTKEARKLGADAIFDVSVKSYTGTCGTDEDEDSCAWAYGMATAIRFNTSG
jgi:uncharacterized protein YbjQ (UPF0145 family)